MSCNTRTAIVFWLLLSTLCVLSADARDLRNESHKRKRHVDVLSEEMIKTSGAMRSRENNGTNCFEAEPCQFGLYKRSHGRMYSFVLIPSWCVCLPTQKCAVDRYDQKKKAEIYTCQNVVRRESDSAQDI